MKYLRFDKLKEHVITIDKELQKFQTEWEPIYNSYIDSLKNCKLTLPFNVKGELSVYLNLGTAKKNVKNEKREIYYLRYLGQNVAEILYDKKTKKIYLSTNKFAQTNARDFNFINEEGRPYEFIKVDWDSEEAQIFKQFFSFYKPRTTKSGKHNDEHRYQNLLLKEFSKETGFDKYIKGIQPVKILGSFFEMPVPLKGFDHKKEGNTSGGHIDILAAIKHGNRTRAAVIEVKDDKYNKKEDINAVLTQALTYACCVRRLLRGAKGTEWAKFFGYSRPISLAEKSITLDVVACIPEIPLEIRDELKNNIKIPIDQDYFALRFISFDVNAINELEIDDYYIRDNKK